MPAPPVGFGLDLRCSDVADEGLNGLEVQEPGPITDDTLQALAGLKQLRRLDLYGTKLKGKPEDRTGTTVYVLDVTKELDAKPEALASLRIQDKKFTPRYLAVQCGQKVEVTWPENEQHNIGISARANWLPGHAMAPDPRRLVHTFHRPEECVRLGCNIHHFEHSFLTVVPNAYFVQTAHDGRFQMPRALPRGEYVVRAVHPRIGSSQVKVTVSGRFKTETVEIGLAAGTWSKLETADASLGR